MAIYVEQCHYTPLAEKQLPSCQNSVAYSLTSGENGTVLTGAGAALVVTSDTAGWFHVSSTSATDKAASLTSHRIQADVRREIGGAEFGMWISFLADA